MTWLTIAIFAKLLPESTRRQNLDWRFIRNLNEVKVPGDENVGAARNRFRQNGNIRFVPYLDDKSLHLPGNDGLPAQEGIKFLDNVSGDSHLLAQDPSKLTQHRDANNQLVLSQDQIEYVGAQSTGRDGAHEDVGVESDLHETSRKTSSSVR